MFFLMFKPKNTNADGILFFNFVYISNFDRIALKASFLAKSFSAFAIPARF